MSMGASGGRTRRSPTRPGARRRLSDDERAQVRALHDDPEAWPDVDETYQQRVVAWLSVRAGLLAVVALCFAAAVAGHGSWWLLGGVGAAASYELLELCRPREPRIKLWP